MTRVLVTGATGFVGSHVVRRLAQTTHDVLSVVRRRSASSALGSMRQVVGSFGDLTPRQLEGIDVVIHCAAASGEQSADLLRTVNAEWTRSLAAAARKAGIRRFIHLSTASVYDKEACGDIAIAEDAPIVTSSRAELAGPQRAMFEYALSKALAEMYLREEADRGLSMSILRPTGVLGIGPTSSWGVRVPTMLSNGDPFPRHSDTTFGFVDIQDLVDAVVAASMTSDNHVLNVVGGNVPFGRYLEAVETLLLDGRVPVAESTALPWRGSYNSSRLRQTLGIDPRSDFDRMMDEIARYWHGGFRADTDGLRSP